MQIFLSFDKPLQVSVADEKISGKCIIVNQNVRHRFSCNNRMHLSILVEPIDLNGNETAVQQQAIQEDLGIYDSPDEFYAEYKQDYRGIKKFLYENIGRIIMINKVAKIRLGKIKKQN